jgi:hypothetical protein
LSYDELAGELAGKVSSVTLGNAHDDLEKEEKVLRNAKTRKCIRYAPNPKHHTFVGRWLLN